MKLKKKRKQKQVPWRSTGDELEPLASCCFLSARRRSLSSLLVNHLGLYLCGRFGRGRLLPSTYVLASVGRSDGASCSDSLPLASCSALSLCRRAMSRPCDVRLKPPKSDSWSSRDPRRPSLSHSRSRSRESARGEASRLPPRLSRSRDSSRRLFARWPTHEYCTI